MPALDQAEANKLLNASFLGAAFTTATGPMKLRLGTTTPTAAAAMTEVTGGSYPAGGITTGGTGGTVFPASGTNGSITNSVASISYTNMPATTVTAVEVWDSGAVLRKWWATITSKTTASGDTITFATNSITASVA